MRVRDLYRLILIAILSFHEHTFLRAFIAYISTSIIWICSFAGRWRIWTLRLLLGHLQSRRDMIEVMNTLDRGFTLTVICSLWIFPVTKRRFELSNSLFAVPAAVPIAVGAVRSSLRRDRGQLNIVSTFSLEIILSICRKSWNIFKSLKIFKRRRFILPPDPFAWEWLYSVWAVWTYFV